MGGTNAPLMWRPRIHDSTSSLGTTDREFVDGGRVPVATQLDHQSRQEVVVGKKDFGSNPYQVLLVPSTSAWPRSHVSPRQTSAPGFGTSSPVEVLYSCPTLSSVG